MLIYFTSALLKIVIGYYIFYYTLNNLDPYTDNLAVFFFVIGIFFLVWGLSFFLFLFLIWFSRRIIYLSKSYKLSLLFSLYVLVNLVLIVYEIWTKLIGLLLFILFIILQYIRIKDER